MNNRHDLLTVQELDDLREIDRLLHAANEHALSIDGHCKSSDGAITVHLGNHWQRFPDEPRTPPTVSIYSYILGPNRNHDFDSTHQALAVVRQWHAKQMSYDAAVDEYLYDGPDLYTEIEMERRRDFAFFMDEMDREMEQ